jgi:hypothetical protein
LIRCSSMRPVARILLVVAVALAGCTPLSPVVRPAPPQVRERPAPSASANPEVEEEFQGQYRAAAKTEYVMLTGRMAPTEAFPDLDALKAFLRPQIDPLMRHRYPHLSDADANAGHRVPEERHNVSVVAYIHAVKHETGPRGDRDFHVMLGSSPTIGSGIFLTAEASGLRAHGVHRQQLESARAELLSIVGICRCDGHFMQVSPPIPVRVTGSLFFDGAHGIGSVGPAYAKPFSVWELHPIMSIERAGPAAPGASRPLSN